MGITVMPAPGRRYANTIINGRFDIWQRGTSFVSPAHNSSNADRFKWGQSAGTAAVTIARSTDVPSGTNLLYSLDIDVTTASATPGATHEAHLRYAVEGYDFAANIYGQATVLSFWVKSNKTGTHCVAVVKSDDSKTYLATYTVSAADTWEQKTLSIPFDAETTAGWDFTTSYGCKLRWTIYAGTNFQGTANTWAAGNLVGTAATVNIADSTLGYLRIAGVVMHPGSVLGDVQHRTFEEELALCKRYYEKSYDLAVTPGAVSELGGMLTNVLNIASATGSTWALGQHPRFTVEKRTTPTILLWTTGGTANEWEVPVGSSRATTATTVSTNAFRLSNNTGSSVTPAAGKAFGHWTADAEI